MAGRPIPNDMKALRRSLESFGFTIKICGPKMFIINEFSTEVFVASRRSRLGYFGLNRVDREMWEMTGAEGVVVFQNIIVQELTKWMYDYALELRAEGKLILRKKKERPAVTITRRDARDYTHEYELRKIREKKKKQAERKSRRYQREEE